jgi:hypothetical protein
MGKIDGFSQKFHNRNPLENFSTSEAKNGGYSLR